MVIIAAERMADIGTRLFEKAGGKVIREELFGRAEDETGLNSI